MTLGKEYVAIGSGSHETWIVETVGEQFNFETGGHLRPCTWRTLHLVRAVIDRLGCEGLRKIGRGDLMCSSRLLGSVIGEGFLWLCGFVLGFCVATRKQQPQ